MKTEKRLTMALSVLVALMMLAVPLASSSNLFVDGGQTNSNGDAPALGAAGDTLTINLNIPENSLDTIDYTNLDLSTTTLVTADKIIYSVDAKAGVIRAICISADDVKIEDVLSEINTALSAANVATDRMTAYDLTFSGNYTTVEGNIKGQITANAVWKLKNTYGEVSIFTKGLGEDSEKIKAYAYADAGKKTELTINALPDYLKTAGNGYVVNLTEKNDQPVYLYTITDSKGNEIKAGDKISSDSSLIATYTFDSLNYGTISVNSPIFDEAITLYVAKTTGAVPVAATTYYMVFNALMSEKYLTEVKDSSNNPQTVEKLSAESTFKSPFTANSGSCKINSWTNGSEDYALNSNSAIAMGSEITLNAEFTTFPVKFMVNGQVQIVNVKYGEFSKASCPFDTAGMTVWVSVDDKGAKSIFNFDRSADELQKELVNSTSEKTLTLIALFSAYDETAYVTFNAGTDAYFDADKKIDTIIVPVAIGTTADKIPVPVSPSKDADVKSYLFAYWLKDGSEYEFKSITEVGADGLTLTAKFVDYKFTINLFVDGNKYGVLYCNDPISYSADAGINTSAVTGVWFDGKTYASSESMNSLVKYIVPEKTGYNFIQWNDKDGKMMLKINLSLIKTPNKIVTDAGFSTISANTDLYAEFDAADYVIIYSGNTAAATNNMIQVGTVGEALNFFSDSTFSNDGYKLKEWNTRPDGKGTSYALGASFTLSGADYDKLSKISSEKNNTPEGIDHGFTLYAIWEKSSGSVTPGDNNEGNNDSNTDTYLLAGILIVIIVLIIVVAVVLRKKQ